MIFSLFLMVVVSQQITITNKPKHDDYWRMSLLRLTNHMIVSDHRINHEMYRCYGVIGNAMGLIQTSAQRLQCIPKKMPTFSSSDEECNQCQQYEIYNIEYLLKLLNGVCAYYEDSKFIWQYCHGEQARQFDTLSTFINKNIAQFEDILLGTVKQIKQQNKEEKQKNYQSLNHMQQIIKSFNQEGLLQNIDVKNIEDVANFIQDKLLEFDNVDIKKQQKLMPNKSNYNYGIQGLRVGVQNQNQFHMKKGIIYSSVPMMQFDPKVQDKLINVKIHCQMKNKTKQFLEARIASPYQIIIDNDECENVKTIMKMSSVQIIKNMDNRSVNLNIFGPYLYGSIDKQCRLWNNSKNLLQSPSLNIEPSSAIMLVTQSYSQKEVKTYIFNVDEIVSFGLVKLYQNAQQKLKKGNADIIVKCIVLQNRPLETQFYFNDATYLSHNLMKIPANVNIGQNLLCVCEINNFSYNVVKITIGEVLTKLKTDYSIHHVYTQHKGPLLSSSNYDEQYAKCKYFDCYKYDDSIKLKQRYQVNYRNIPATNKSKQQQKIIAEISEQEFSSLQRLTKKKNIIQLSNNQNLNSIAYIIDISQYGILQVIMQDKQQKNQSYLLTQKGILMMRKNSNNSKQFIKQNPYYENSENYSSIVIYNDGIWRNGDRIIFPRMMIQNRRILKFQVVVGQAFIRSVFIDKLKFRFNVQQYGTIMNKYFYTTKIKTKKIQINKGMEQWPSQDYYFISEKQAVLQQSLNTSSYLQNGDFCGNPINKSRKATVYIQCGQSWSKLTKVQEITPCNYRLTMQTRLLCKKKYNKVIRSIQQMPSYLNSQFIKSNDTLCSPLLL